MSRFAPVFLPHDLNGRASVTFLKKFSMCPRSAYFYALHRKTPVQTAQMVRGTAFHLIAERAITAMVNQDEAIIPPELVKVIADEVLAEVHVPIEEHDRLREMSYRWASETAVDPGQVIACETLVCWDAGPFTVRGKVDFAELLDEGNRVVVRDWKSSMAAPSFEEIARKRPDGSYAAKNAQLVMYALLLAFGVPVREEVCPVCHGMKEWSIPNPGGPPDGETCDECEGRGTVEIPEPFGLAPRAQVFEMEFVFPAIEDREGKMLRRQVSLNATELAEYRASMTGLLERLQKAEQTGDWPAVVSDAACNECPCPAYCPIPRELRDGKGEIATPEDAAAAAEVLDRLKDDVKVLGGLLRGYLKGHDAVSYGMDKIAEISHETAEKVDRDGMLAAMERHYVYGEPFERSDWIRVEDRFPLKLRSLTVDEIEDRGSTSEADTDRWGDAAPF